MTNKSHHHHRNDHHRSATSGYYWFFRLSLFLILALSVIQLLYSSVASTRSKPTTIGGITIRHTTSTTESSDVSHNEGFNNGAAAGGGAVPVDSRWTYDDDSHYVRCDMFPDIHIAADNYHYEAPEQQAKCIKYPPNLPAFHSLAQKLKADEVTKARNGNDSQIFTIFHTTHQYRTPTTAASSAESRDYDYGGHLFVIHENCHANVSLADTNPDIAAEVNRRYGPTSLELRLIGPEMQVIPLAYIDPKDYTDRHRAYLARESLRPPIMGRTGQDEFDEYRVLHPLTSWNNNDSVGKFCPTDAWLRDYGSGHFNERTCHVRGNDRCVYEAAYAVSLVGEYSVQAYFIYADYEGVSNVQPRLRWPRPQNALFFHSPKRHLSATPQPWPRPKGYSDFLRYSPAPSPISSPNPLRLRRRQITFDGQSPIPMIESTNSGRWVRKTDFPSLGITNGSVWWPRRYYWRPATFFCQIADMNDYYYVPYSYDHELRMQQWKENSASGFRIVQKNTDLALDITGSSKSTETPPPVSTPSSSSTSYLQTVLSYLNVVSYFLSSDALTPVEPVPILLPPDTSQLTRSKPMDFSTMRKCLSGRRIAFSGDSQSRQLVGMFLSVLAGSDIVLHKQKWKGVQLRWDCRTIGLTDNPQLPDELSPAVEATEFDELTNENITLAENELKVCYIPLSDMHYSVDLMYQALIADFDIIMINAGQHPLSFDTKQRSFPYFALWQRDALDGIRQRYYNHLTEVIHEQKASKHDTDISHKEHIDSHILHLSSTKPQEIQRYTNQLMKERMMWWSIMPMPRALMDRYFDKNDGDGRTLQRIEAANEAMKGVMTQLGVTVYDQTESIHWPFLDCCQDSAHANEPTFHTIVADMFELFYKQLNCSA